MSDTNNPIQINKSFYPIVEPIVDSAAFIGLGILASSYFTTWISDPVSHSGIAFAGILSAASIQLAKKMPPHPNNFFLRKIDPTMTALGITTISLPPFSRLFVNQIGVISEKAAFQIGVINLSVKVGMHVIQLLYSKFVKPKEIDPSKGPAKPTLPFLPNFNTFANFTKEEATIEYNKLLSGEYIFLDINKEPNVAIYKSYFSLFKKHGLTIPFPKTVEDIQSHNLSTSAMYFSFIQFNRNWSTLPLCQQYCFLQNFRRHGLQRSNSYYRIFPNSIQEIENASKEIIAHIHHEAKNNIVYYHQLLLQATKKKLSQVDYERSLQSAFEKHGLSKVSKHLEDG